MMENGNKAFENVTHYTKVDVQPGGINIQHVEHLHQADVLKALGIELEIKKPGQVSDSTKDDVTKDGTMPKDDELFHFLYPGIDDEEGRKIHLQVKDLVKRFTIKDICNFLKRLSDDKKILLPQIPQNAFDELHRMGLPPADTEGYGYDNFCKYYKKIK